MKRIAAAIAIAVTAGAVGAGTALAATGFSDVPDSSPFASDIEFVRDAGITAGCLDGTVYCPGDAVTREQMAAFLHRLSGNDPDVAPSVDALTLDGFPASSFTLGTFSVQSRYSGGRGAATCPAGTTVVAGGFFQDPGQANVPVGNGFLRTVEEGDQWLVQTVDPGTGQPAGSGDVQAFCQAFADSDLSPAQVE